MINKDVTYSKILQYIRILIVIDLTLAEAAAIGN
jgi:hypothetical protein